jgi:hypothetical protein
MVYREVRSASGGAVRTKGVGAAKKERGGGGRETQMERDRTKRKQKLSFPLKQIAETESSPAQR